MKARLAVVAGGVAGTAARTALSDVLDGGPSAWPWGTLAVNLAGALALGYVLGRFLAHPDHWTLGVLFVAVGLLGALTTFSALVLQVWRLSDEGRAGYALAYAAVSVAGGLAAALTGARVAEERA